MNDLISRQAAIAVADYSDYAGLSVDDVKKVTDEVVKGLRRLPSAEQWIPCSERLPSIGQAVFRTIKKTGWNGEEYRMVDIGHYDTNDGSILAWLPLPEPWKGE